ncbi:ABC-type Na+ efflux pump permease subunit [Paenibacillus sp. W4I10]|nr:ABC-type Na+ efflux pump permease subunit [Paenibacillus sp. W4I10]
MGMTGIMVITLLMSAAMITLLYYVTKKAYSRKWDEDE